MEQEVDENNPEPTVIEREQGSTKIDVGVTEGFAALPSDENERLIALCEAPALLWYQWLGTAAPFGLIA